MKLMISERQRCDGELLPPFWYGLSYRDFCRCVEIFHPIPINYLIRVGRFIQHCWDRFRSRPTWTDKQVYFEARKIHLRERKYYKEKLETELKFLRYVEVRYEDRDA